MADPEAELRPWVSVLAAGSDSVAGLRCRPDNRRRCLAMRKLDRHEASRTQVLPLRHDAR